ncbi:aspartate kinase [Actinomyces vulturis]|uniref:aspartate kinase n=1 Tax=Actinomyces vulturis TaxID=1857645 RepID=UPI00083717F3|nr:aspartate kinase [Actinomyces vulturis]
MALVVQKYGGSSVSDLTAIKRVAQRVVDTQKAGNTVVVVVSAMGDTTDDLLDMAGEITRHAPAREMDILLSAGERISMALLAMAINELGVSAQAYTGAQAGVRTDAHYGRASIVGVLPERVARSLHDGAIAIVAGFQGVNEFEDTTTLGRGGSDTTAVALAAALNADVCEIYTDVDGLFTADPRIVPSARRIERLSSEETLEMAAHGAKILHLRAVEYARRYGVALHVRSSFSDKTGTWIYDGHSPTTPSVIPRLDIHQPTPLTPIEGIPSCAVQAPDSKEQTVETPIISGITHDRSMDKITVVGVDDTPGFAAQIFAIVAGVGVSVDMIVQDATSNRGGKANISFTIPEADSQTALDALIAAQDELGFEALEFNNDIGKLALVGAGMRSHPGVCAQLFQALREAGINIHMIATSEIRISVMVDLDDLDHAVRSVHTAFGLDSPHREAIVYGGTGR